jgi:hypothetical protein
MTGGVGQGEGADSALGEDGRKGEGKQRHAETEVRAGRGVDRPLRDRDQPSNEDIE